MALGFVPAATVAEAMSTSDPSTPIAYWETSLLAPFAT